MHALLRVTARIVIVLVGAFAAGGCFLLNHPFTLNNPNDPGNQWLKRESFGRSYLDDSSIIPGMNDIAASGGLIAVVSNRSSRVWIVNAASGALEHAFDSESSMSAVCLDAAGALVYSIDGWHRVKRTEIASGTTSTIYSLADDDPASFHSIAIDPTGLLWILASSSGPTSTSSWIVCVDGAGSLVRTLSPPYLNDVREIQAGDQLYASLGYGSGGAGSNSVISFDKTSGAPMRQIYFDGTTYQGRDLTSVLPVAGNRNPGAIALAPASNRLFVNFGAGGDPALVCEFDPTNLAAPLAAQHALSADFSDPWQVQLAADQSGRLYATDSWRCAIRELVGGALVYSRAPQPGEIWRANDVTRGTDGRIYIVDGDMSQLSSFDPSSGTFRMIGTPGTAAGELAWAQAAAADSSSVYCAVNGNGNSILRFDLNGNFVDEHSSLPAPVARIGVLADGRLVGWSRSAPGGPGFYLFDASLTPSGPYLQQAPFSAAEDVVLCRLPNGKTYCGAWGQSFASVGVLADDLSSYNEVWSSSRLSGVTTNGNWDFYRIAGIAPAPGNDLWIALSGLSAAARVDPSGNVVASMSTWDDRPGTKWTPFEIVAYADSANRGWQSSDLGGIVERPEDHSLYLFDNGTRLLERYAPEEALP